MPGKGILDGGKVLSPATGLELVADENVFLDRSARMRLRVLDSTNEGIYQVDSGGRCTFMNRAACCMLGYGFDEALGKTMRELPPGLPDDRPLETANDPVHGRFEQPVSRAPMEDIFRRTDGSSFPVQFRSHPIFEDGLYQGTVVSFRDIAERKRIERRLKAQHAVSRTLEGTASVEAITPLLLRSLGESLGLSWGAFWQVDEKENVLSLSSTWRSSSSGFETFEEACRNAVFFRGQELPGKVWASGEAVWLSDVAGDHSAHCAAASRAGFRAGIAVPIRMTQKIFGVFEFFAREHMPVDADLLGVLGLMGGAIGQVIERKQSESIRTRLAAILDAATGFAGLVIDPDGKILSVSRAVQTIFGFSQAELIGQPLTALIPEYRQALREYGWGDDLSLGSSPSAPIRMRGRRRTGETALLELSLGECADHGLRVIAGVIHDVTERVKSQDILERQAEHLRRSEDALLQQTCLVNSIITSMADGVIAADENGDVVLYNPAAAALIGDAIMSAGPGADMLANPGFALFLADRRTPCPPEELPLHRAAVRGETVDAVELFFKTPPRPEGFWINATARPMIDHDGRSRGGVLVFRDVTEQKAARETLRQAKEEAEAANRAKSEFLSRMSHELRTPMNAILGFAQLLENEALPSEQADAIARILKAGRHLLGLINEVLDISRIEAGGLNLQMERLRPFDVMQAALELMAPLAAERKIELVAPLPSEARWYIDADRQRLTQVSVNLLGNAIKYNRDGGQVRVSLEEIPGQRLRIKVADTGFGIAPEQLKKLFVPFERLGAERSGIEGTGLGLAYSNSLVVAMGGILGVESEAGKGSVFWIETPLSGSEHRTPPVSLPSSSELPDNQAVLDAGSAQVLYIQDDPASSRAIEKIFGRLPGYGFVLAERGRIGLQKALEHPPALVLLDRQLPDMDAAEVLRELRSHASTRQVPIVVVGAGWTEEMRRKMLDAGAHSCLAKPIQARDFLDAIAGLL